MIRLVITDDHAIVRSGLKQLFALQADIRVVGEASNGDELLTMAHNVEMDLLLLDMNMPGVSGVNLISRIKAFRKDLPVLVLSMYNDLQVAMRALKAGANGYITKDSDPEMLMAAIRKVAAGGRYIEPMLAEQMVFDTNSSKQQLPHEVLSDREFEVFRLLAAGKSVNEIAERLVVSNKTVSTYKIRLMDKLQLSSTADLVRYAILYDIPA